MLPNIITKGVHISFTRTYDVDDIGHKILEAMEHGDKQPELKSFVEKEDSLEKCSRLLHDALL